MIKRLIYLAGVSVFLLAVFVGEIQAQGKIVGKIRDLKTRDPLIGVNVIVASTTLGTVTDIEGDYVIVNVPVGTYSVSAGMVGRNKVTKKSVVVSLNQTTAVDYDLEETVVAGQEVVVTAERNLLHKEVSGSQVVISNQQITETAGIRTLQEFLSTQVGISGSEYLNIRGGRPSETGTMVDGLTMVDARVGKAQSFIPTSAVEQVSLKAGGMNA